MKTVAYKSLDKLEPNFMKKVSLFLNEVNKNGNVIFITESWRSEERQKELISAGLSKVNHSNHQDGLAVDIGFLGNELYPVDVNKWRNVADIAKRYGIDWGYDLWKWDKPHFQNNGLPILEIKEKSMSKYTEIMKRTLEETKFSPIFITHDGDKPITEGEVKELIEIAFARVSQRKI